MKKFFVIVLIFLMMFNNMPLSVNAQGGVPGLTINTNARNSRGGSMRYIELSGNYRFVARLIQAVGGHAPASEMIEYAGQYGNVVAAFTGPFFSVGSGVFDRAAEFRQTQSIIHSNAGAIAFTRYDRWVMPTRHRSVDLSMHVGNNPVLVRYGKPVFHEPANDFLAATAQRTLVGFRTDNSLVVVEGSMNFHTAAETLTGMGVVWGTNMDGGASSFLYANGTMIRSPGRNLPHIIVVYAKPPLTAQPTLVTAVVGEDVRQLTAFFIEGNRYFHLADLINLLDIDMYTVHDRIHPHRMVNGIPYFCPLSVADIYGFDVEWAGSFITFTER